MKIIFNLLLVLLVTNSTWSSEVEEEVNNNNNNNNELKIDGKVLELDDSNFDTDLHLRYPPQSVFSIVVSKWCFLDRLRLDSHRKWETHKKKPDEYILDWLQTMFGFQFLLALVVVIQSGLKCSLVSDTKNEILLIARVVRCVIEFIRLHDCLYICRNVKVSFAAYKRDHYLVQCSFSIGKLIYINNNLVAKNETPLLDLAMKHRCWKRRCCPDGTLGSKSQGLFQLSVPSLEAENITLLENEFPNLKAEAAQQHREIRYNVLAGM
ncbi:hypothetical protein ACFE04_006643 [Oxalis oulophora]